MTAFALLTLSLAASPFDFDAEGRVLPLSPTQFALLYDDAGNTMNPATPPERAASRRAVLARIEARKPKLRGAAEPLIIEQSDDLLAVGLAHEAIELLRPYGAREPDFRIMANLVRANAQAGEWQQALLAYSLLRDLPMPTKPPLALWKANLDRNYRKIWLYYQRDLARDKPDATGLKPIPFFKPGALPPDALAIVQQLALENPSDLFLLWSLAEVHAELKDFRTAEQMLNRCANSGLTQPKSLMARRAEMHEIVENLPKLKDEDLLPPPPAPKGLFDLVDPVKFVALSTVFVVVAAGLLMLQLRSHRRKRRR